MDIIKELKKIDKWLESGDREYSHYLITKLIEELDDPGRIKDTNKKKN